MRKNELYAVKMYANQPRFEIVEKQEGDSILNFCYREIECDLITIPPSEMLKAPYILIADDEGLLRDKPYLNIVGSYFYGAHKHGNPLVGHVLVMKEDAEDIRWLTFEEAEEIMELIADKLVPAISAAIEKAR